MCVDSHYVPLGGSLSLLPSTPKAMNESRDPLAIPAAAVQCSQVALRDETSQSEDIHCTELDDSGT